MKPSVVEAAGEKLFPWTFLSQHHEREYQRWIAMGSFYSFTFLENLDMGLSYIVFVGYTCHYGY